MCVLVHVRAYILVACACLRVCLYACVRLCTFVLVFVCSCTRRCVPMLLPESLISEFNGHCCMETDIYTGCSHRCLTSASEITWLMSAVKASCWRSTSPRCSVWTTFRWRCWAVPVVGVPPSEWRRGYWTESRTWRRHDSVLRQPSTSSLSTFLLRLTCPNGTQGAHAHTGRLGGLLLSLQTSTNLHMSHTILTALGGNMFLFREQQVHIIAIIVSQHCVIHKPDSRARSQSPGAYQSLWTFDIKPVTMDACSLN